MDAAERRQRLSEMLDGAPDDPELRYMLAMEHASAQDDEAALTQFRELINRRPDYPPAYHQAARALQRLNRADDARALLEQGIPIAIRQGNEHAAGEMSELLDMLE